MTEHIKQWLAWLTIAIVTLAVALFFGVKYPIPPAPESPLEEPAPLGAHFSNPVDIEGSSSASAPALTFEGDTDTGIFRSAANTLNFTSGGSEMLEIDSSGFTISSATALDVDGGASIDGGTLDVNDAIDQDGSADEIQLAVTGYTTQTSDLAFFDGGLVDIGSGTYATADGDNDLGIAGDLEVDGAIDADGNVTIAGTATLADKLTVNDQTELAGVADEVQLSVKAHSTQTSNITEWFGTEGTVVSSVDKYGTFKYYDNTLYSFGCESDFIIAVGTDTITGTLAVTHNVTAGPGALWASCTLGQDPAAGAGEAAHCTVSISSDTVTVKVWQDDFVSAATVGATVHWSVIGYYDPPL